MYIMLKTSTRFFNLTKGGRRFFSVVPRETLTGPKSAKFDALLLRSLRNPQTEMKIEQFPKKQSFVSDEVIEYEVLLENPQYSVDVDECKAKRAKLGKTIEAILPTEELIPLQGKEDEEGRIKSYDEQEIEEMIMPGFMYHVNDKNPNDFQQIVKGKRLEARQANNGFGAFAYSLSGMYRDFPDWIKRVFSQTSNLLIFVPRDLNLKPITLRKSNGEIVSEQDINFDLVLTVEPSSNGSKKIVIHDYTLTALLIAKFVENFQIGEQIIKAIFAEYKLGEPTGDLYADAKHILKSLNHPHLVDRKFNNFKKYVDGLLDIHSKICDFIDADPKLSEKLTELNLLTAVKEIPKQITNTAGHEEFISPSFASK